MPHILLLLQLKAHDIGEDIIDLIEQWLCTRWRGFKLEISLEWGTTMVSIKAFIILNIYINDFDDNITCGDSGDRTHPCLTPDVTWNQYVSPLGVRTEIMLLAQVALMLSRSCPFTL